MELVNYKSDIKFRSHPMPILVYDEGDKYASRTGKDKLSTDSIDVTRLYQYELFSNLNKKINIYMKKNIIYFFLLILLIILLFLLLIT